MKCLTWTYALAAAGLAVAAASIDECPGYKASNIVEGDTGLTADLTLAGEACNAYGLDLQDLKLVVEYQTEDRLHVVIHDADEQVYQVPESYISRPESSKQMNANAALSFDLKQDPFSFTIRRKGSGEILFDTSRQPLVFESQFLRLRTSLPDNANLYGLGEHSDPFRLPTQDYTRTLWNGESPFIPRGSNLYGSHPMYLEHRTTGSHGVFFLNSNGMDIKINTTAEDGTFLEYNTLGGILDLYFLAGDSPKNVSKQYAEVVGLPAMMPYWSLGFHQAKYGYWDVNYLAEVVANYSAAGIPLEVIWADIDYMDLRKNFVTDPVNFPMDKMRELVDTLHDRHQSFIMMLDPGTSTNTSYDPYIRGLEADAFLLADDGSPYRGVQWAGEVVWPDYTSPEGVDWWVNEMDIFFDPDTGLDVDGLWNDMNEASNFCPDTTCDPKKHADDTNTPPDPPFPGRPNTGRPIPGFPDSFQPNSTALRTRASGDKKGLPGRDLLNPEYRINNHLGDISDNTIWTNITNHDGTSQYDTHNMYGLSMVKATRAGLIKRRPSSRPFVLTRSTFSSSSAYAAHWFGDNNSTWSDYRVSIPQMLGFTAVLNHPMVGSDVCGFNGKAEEAMCARWAMLGAFMPFYRNHADISSDFQEFYQWPSVAAAAKRAIDARYHLLDYIYTALYRASATGVPSVNPLFFVYPEDEGTWAIDTQFFLGESILVSPVTNDDSQTVNFYLPNDVFYDFWTGDKIEGSGAVVERTGVAWDDIPVHIRGGSIIPMRSESANTTTDLRGNDFTLLVAPGRDGKARGSLYLDDGETMDTGGEETSDITFEWDGVGVRSTGRFGYKSRRVVEKIVVLADEDDEVVGSWSLDREFDVEIRDRGEEI
ncbi:glycosyl hydrolases family 31-domain-containing protein [Emericellopsis atlantica]|uniref:alpha-glucosidase n=1 Tax=Emericellopsis atlantica TaxID=2614577 RepID=A0A9P8CNV1_9HYPO|nr:glycosyl hydrolases family 31-domain-containing protein [Emericellopsis atlantica]KAG9253470.1 glycosyl hydrolases family 31-domain-containing protein [Emericellopsis atlantica]